MPAHFCTSTKGCERLLFVAYLTFETCEGDDFDDSASFDETLGEVDQLSDASFDFVIEGGPAMASKYGIYFCSSGARVAQAVKNFLVASAEYTDVEGDHCSFCQSLNAPAAGDTCAHNVGWRWDGTYELDADLNALQRSFEDAGEHFRTLSGSPEFEGSMADLVGGAARRQKLIDLAAEDADFSDVLEAIGVSTGDGWQTQGMLGGSGHNLYSNDLQAVKDAQ